MLNKVHHVTYVVESVSDMAAYLETSSSHGIYFQLAEGEHS